MLFLYFFLAFALSLCVTPLVRSVMQRCRITDNPKNAERKIHKKPIPLGGGLAIYVSFFLVVLLAVFWRDVGIDIKFTHLAALALGGLVLMIGGIVDDKYILRPRIQIIFPILATLIVIFSGIQPHEITNPWGGSWRLDQMTVSIPVLGNVALLANVMIFFWLMGMMFTTKFLDGLDGLVTGVVAIGALMIFFLSRQTAWWQPEMARLSLMFFGACMGFWIWNRHPARIFLGEGGSLFTGFALGVLAILSGGKIATTLLVVGVPMLDVVRVILRRIQRGQPVFVGDKEHLHFKLLDSGLSQRQAVLLLYSISLLFGLTTLFLQSKQKLMALLLLFILMLLAGIWFSRKSPAKE